MTSETSIQSGRLVTGLVIPAVGVLFLLDNLAIVDTGAWADYWPLILIALGLGHWLSPERRCSGAWLILVGGVMLLHTLDIVRLGDSWPLFVVAAGLGLSWRAWVGERRCLPGVDCCLPEVRRHAD